MAQNVFVKYRQFLPGAGHNRSGVAKQGKTNLRGRIEVSSYTRGGESLTPADLGLTFIDDLTLTLEEPFMSSDPGENRRQVGYSRSAAQFYCLKTRTGDEAGEDYSDELAGGTALNLTFDAFGDSAHDVELT